MESCVGPEQHTFGRHCVRRHLGLAPIDRSNVAAARAAGFEPQVIKARGPKPDFDALFKAMEGEGAQIGWSSERRRLLCFLHTCNTINTTNTYWFLHPEVTMGALSIRIEPELGKMLDLEVARRKTTRSKYVQFVLQQALAPKDPLALLVKVRNQYGITGPKVSAPRTKKSSDLKAQVRAAIEHKHSKSSGARRRKATAE